MLLVFPHFYRARLLKWYMMKCAWIVMISLLVLYFHDSCSYIISFPKFGHSFSYFPIKEMNCICDIRCRRGNNHFDVHFWRIRSVRFPSKDGKDASYEGWNGWKCVCFLRESAFQPLMFYSIKVLFPICTLTWRVNNYIYRQGKSINRRN